jgi:DNA repair photolyase
MNKTQIEWCNYTWNPITGCLHNCSYCYAKVLAETRLKDVYMLGLLGMLGMLLGLLLVMPS